MSLRKPPQNPAFRLTLWARASNPGAAARRARWTASLAVLGIRAFEKRSGGMVSLWREGEEAISTEAERHRLVTHRVTPPRSAPKP